MAFASVPFPRLFALTVGFLAPLLALSFLDNMSIAYFRRLSTFICVYLRFFSTILCQKIRPAKADSIYFGRADLAEGENNRQTCA